MAERWLSVEEISAHWGVSADTIYERICRKKVPARKVGGLWELLATKVGTWGMKGMTGQKEI